MGLTMRGYYLVQNLVLKVAWGVPALILGTFINALHAVSAAILVIMSVPETLSEFDLSVNVVFAN